MRVRGHRDFAATACPGRYLYRELQYHTPVRPPKEDDMNQQQHDELEQRLKQWAGTRFDGQAKWFGALFAALGQDIRDLTVSSEFLQKVVVSHEDRIRALESHDDAMTRDLAGGMVENRLLLTEHRKKIGAINERLRAAGDAFADIGEA